MTIKINKNNHLQRYSDSVKTSFIGKDEIKNSFKRLPLLFVPNAGQTNSKVRFHSHGAGLGIFFTPEEVMFSFIQKTSVEEENDASPLDASNMDVSQTADTKLQGMAVALKLIGATPRVEIEGEDKDSGKVNFLKRNNPNKWHSNLPTYKKLVYKELWQGIDLTFHEEGGRLKYEFIVHPGARHENIRLSYDGADTIYLDEEDNLVIDTAIGRLVDKCPESYQVIDGRKVPVDSGFTLKQQIDGKYVHGFKVEKAYNHSYPLIIDPGIYYSTFLGGSGADRGGGIAVDSAGSAYVTGITSSPDFPTTPGAFDTSINGGGDVFVTKLSPDGSSLVYSTYLGGSATETGIGIAVDSSGSAYVTGVTSSPDFPTTPGAFDTSFNGFQDAFVTKLSPNGSTLVYSTFLGGINSDSAEGLAVDSSGSAYVTGSTNSPDFPTTPGAFDTSINGGFDAFVTKLSPDGSTLVYSTFLGGIQSDQGRRIAVDNSNNAYVTGNTGSSDFPTTPGALDTSINGGSDVFITKLSSDGSSLVYSTFLGGTSSDLGLGIVVDSSGSAYVTGSTFSTDFPTTPGAFDTSFNGIQDAFVTKLSPNGSSLVYSTYLGGSSVELGLGIDIDSSGNSYVTGPTSSTDFPITPGAFDASYNGNQDAFVSKLSPDGSTLIYSSYLGGSNLDEGRGIAVDNFESAYVSGYTTSSDFPTTPGAFDSSFNGVQDAFVTKLTTTPQGQIDILIAEVEALVDQGVLNRGQGNALLTTLRNALRQLNRGNCSGAVNQLQAFINQVNAFINAGFLTPAQGQELISEANRTIDFINYICDGSPGCGCSEAIAEARTEKVQELINNLGNSDFCTRVAATEELGKRIKGDPGTSVIDCVKVLADMNDCEVRYRVDILMDIQMEKERLAFLNNELDFFNSRIGRLTAERQRIESEIREEHGRYDNKPGN